MSALKYFKNTPGRSPIRRQDLSVIFFLQIRNEIPWKKRVCRPLGGWQGPLTLYKPCPPYAAILFVIWDKKIRKKERGEEKKSGEALPNCVLVIYR